MSVQQQLGQMLFALCVCMHSKLAEMYASQHMTCVGAELYATAGCLKNAHKRWQM